MKSSTLSISNSNPSSQSIIASISSISSVNGCGVGLYGVGCSCNLSSGVGCSNGLIEVNDLVTSLMTILSNNVIHVVGNITLSPMGRVVVGQGGSVVVDGCVMLGGTLEG